MTPAIPVIDVAAAEAGDHTQLEAVRTATEEFGAVQVVNHGVPQDLVADLNARAGRLLGLPRAEKAKLASPHPYRGWRQWPDDFGRLELERFNVAQFDDIEAARAAGIAQDHLGLFAHANLWPASDPGLREVALAYIEASRALAARMLGLYAAAQGLPADSFGLGALPHLRLTVNDYPTWAYPETALEEDKLLLLEHADDSAVTVLAQHGDYEGLQVQGPGGVWIPVPVIPGALQVFSGQLLARWTGGRLRPGRHRVVAGGTVTRRSMAVFVYPDLEAVVDGVRVWDHVKGRVAAYLAEYGLPDQVAAWREGLLYVAELADNSAGHLLFPGYETSLTGIGPGTKLRFDEGNKYQFQRSGRRAPARRPGPAAPADRDLDPGRDPGRAAAARLVPAAVPDARRRPGRLPRRRGRGLPAAHLRGLPGQLRRRLHPGRGRPGPGRGRAAAGPRDPAADRPELRPRRRVQLPPGRVAARDPRGAGQRAE